MKHSSKVLGAFLAMALCLPLHAAKIYKWQDESGSWHYSEKPPLEENAEVIKIKSTPANADDTESNTEETANTPKSTEVIEEKAKEPLKKSPEVLAAEQARKTENCNKAKKNLDTLTYRSKVLIDDEERGEQRYLDEKEHEEWMDKSRKQVEEFCN
ncbi:DUF4124 domain-containing protein [Porticoccus sp.]